METNETQSGNELADFSAQITQAVKNAASSIVAVDARPRVATSGIVWRGGGVIVSTNHTIHRDENIVVAIEGGKTVSAKLVGRDGGTDLAVLKIEDQSIGESVKPAEIIETTSVKAGNIVLAVGRTDANGGATASFGIVNQVSGAWRTWRGDEIERLISLDLAIRLGFSGGALVDPNGKILGVNTSAFGRGLALTIPSETVNRVVEQILTKGSVARPYLGIGTQAVPISENLREKLNLEQTGGLMMLTVEQDGAAEKSGVLIGDILLSINEKMTLEPMDVQSALWGKSPGETVKAQILRGGEFQEIEVVLGERPAAEEGERFFRGWKGGRRGGRKGWRRGGR